ncbi:MAG: hypothetical protein AMXMBFR4_32810 [Candidatus Hydrogenedentota bacterium]
MVFFDMQHGQGEEALDGLEVDRKGNLFVSGPGGTWVISPRGKHLGMIVGPELPANYAWGDSDGQTLYIAARTSIYPHVAKRHRSYCIHGRAHGHLPHAHGKRGHSRGRQVTSRKSRSGSNSAIPATTAPRPKRFDK